MGIRNFLWLLLLASMWGPSFIFIKVAVEEISPITVALGRVSLAAVTLYLVLRVRGGNLPGFGPVWKHFAVMGFFSNALPFALFSWGEQYIDSALAAILNGTTPLFTIVLAHFLFTDDRITVAKLGGVLLGFGGLVVLIIPAFVEGVYATIWGLLAIAVAAFSYGVAIVYSRKNLRGHSRLVPPTAQLIMAALYLLPLSLFFEQPYKNSFPSWLAVGSVVVLALVGTAFAFPIYYHVMERTSATYLSMVTYLVPVVGVVLGVLVLDERLQWNAYVGCALILSGVMVVNGIFKQIRSWFRQPANVSAGP